MEMPIRRRQQDELLQNGRSPTSRSQKLHQLHESQEVALPSRSRSRSRKHSNSNSHSHSATPHLAQTAQKRKHLLNVPCALDLSRLLHEPSLLPLPLAPHCPPGDALFHQPLFRRLQNELV